MKKTFEPHGWTKTLYLAVILTVASCSSPTETTVERGVVAPPEMSDGWSVGTPESAGLDSGVLSQLAAEIRSGQFPNTHALLVEHDGVLVFEEYFTGTDERWGDPLGEVEFGPDTLHDLRSISKSVTSILVGIMLEKDLAEAVEKPVLEYLPDLGLDESKRSVTLHHVLTMTAGLEWNEMTVPYTDDTNDELRMDTAVEPTRFVLERPLVSDPGSQWYYSGGLSQLLASVIFYQTGQRLDEYARVKLFEPLEIQQFEWVGAGNQTPDNPAAASGLRLRARDLAKIGSCMLHGGKWKDRQVVPEQWVELSGTRFVPEIGEWSRNGMWGYGYQWWVGNLPGGEKLIAGVGNGNQRLFILPEQKMVVTIFAGEYNRFEGHSDRLLSRVLESQKTE